MRPGARAMLMLLVLSGCSFVPTSEPLPVTVPAEFSQSGERQLTDKWWREFGDATLNQLVEKALSENFSLQAGWKRLEQAEAVAIKAGASRLPAVSLTAGQSRTRQDTGSDIGNTNKRSFGLQASYELDLWGRVAAEAESARASYLASAESLDAAAITLAASVTNTWYKLLAQREQVVLVQSQLESTEDTLKLTRMRYQYGQVAFTDVLQQEQLLQSTQADLVLAQSEQDVLQQQLNILLGDTPQTSGNFPSSVLPLIPVLPDTGIPANVIARRPDLRQQWYSYEAARQKIGVAEADRMPALTLKASFDSTASSWGNLFDSWALALAGNLAAPVFDGGRRSAEADRAVAVAGEALHTYTQSVLDALGEVEAALTREAAQQHYLDKTLEQTALAKQVLEQIRLRYAKGTENYLAVLNAQQQLYKLERQLLTSRVQHLEYRVDLYRALGGGFLTASADMNSANSAQ
ncbi:efflux transporter outer membrane subunit [Endozoicomonadaceae bacterium StTr2]